MPTFEDRAVGAFLGLALGDAYGRPLEFINAPRVYNHPVDTSRLMWTDDTHMSLYLANAVPEPGVRFDPNRFGQEVADQFLAWASDPLTPSTAPGNTCLSAVARYASGIPWEEAGIARSDGCGAVMRIVPLPIRFSGKELGLAARISAAVTHRHPNALAGAIACSWLVRQLLEGHPMTAALVLESAEEVTGPKGSIDDVPKGLKAAIQWALSGEGDWLDEQAIPTYDGGWRTASALGLAVAAVMRWGGDFKAAVEKAGRIDGDSDSVACMAGMMMGAMGGTAVLPNDWLDALVDRDVIEAAARRLAQGPPRPRAEPHR